MGSFHRVVVSYENEDAAGEEERTLVLVGRTGNGKSATGNSILGENKFASKRRGRAVTKQCELHTSKLNGLTINVIDTPGLFSASSTTEFTSREIFRCLRLAKNGIDAVLLVLSVTNRLTDEEKSTLPTLKILFGSEIVDYMIVVFTNGDALEQDGDTLESYLEDCHDIKEILKECGDRKVLFDNSPYVSQRKKQEQVEELFNLVNQISVKNNGRPYMADLSLELRENEASFQEKHKRIEAMKGLSSKQERSQLKALEKSYKEMLKGMEAKVSNKLEESLKDVKEQLAKAQESREEAHKKMSEIQKLSSEEIKRLREQLNKAEKETASLRAQLNKRCSVL